MDSVNTAAKTGSFTTNNSKDQKLGESYGANLNTQEQIGRDKAKTQQDIDTYTEQMSYAKQNSGSIDRNINNQVMQEVMSKHPELTSKDQAARWMKRNRSEADSIAKPIVDNYNPFESFSYKSKVSKIGENTSGVKNTEMRSQESLKTNYEEAASMLQEQAVVKDATGSQKPLEKVVDEAANNSGLRYNKNVENVLQDSLNPQEKKTMQDLENEKLGVEGHKTKSGKIMKSVDKSEKRLDGIVGDSTVARVLDDIGNTSSQVLGLDDKRRSNKK